jgi:tRNA threonylcarbamoyladenosine biosynthesis protein TsaE
MEDSTIFISSEATQDYGATLGKECRGGEIFALYGTLGAGKTQLVKGIARGLEFYGEVTSPTFTLVHEYLGGRLPLYHLDLYRLESEQAMTRLFIEEYLPSGGVTVIEWPERIEHMLPPETRRYEILIVSLTERVVRLREGAAEP